MAAFLTEIRDRRILPAVGVYAAGCWVLIEILDRLVQRYLLSPYLTDIVFWGLYSMIPAVILVAWSYGRPGKDRATVAQKVGVPINIIATVGLLITTFGGKDLGAAAEKLTLANEEGQVETHYVPTDAYRRRLAVFFFDNRTGDSGQDWLQYAVTEMLVQDLQQDPFMSVVSPWSNWSNGYFPRMQQAGFEDGLKVPRSLMREITERANRQYFVEGSIDRQDGEYRITARVWSSRTLELVDEFQRTGWDLYGTVDGLSRSIREALEVPDAGRIAEDLPLAETYGESEQALRLYIQGLNARLFDNDVPGANEFYRLATEADPNFVLAWFMMALNQYDGGDMGAAQESLARAQALDYRLPAQDRAVLKQAAYRLSGQTDKMIAFMRLQVQLRDDAASHQSLATILMYTGDSQGAKTEFQAALERDPLNTGLKLNLAVLERATGNFDGAIRYAHQYQEERPEEDQALLLLGDLYRDNGDRDAAARYYQQAQLLAEPPVEPMLRLADLAARAGDSAAARALIEQADSASTSPADHLKVHAAAAQLEYRLGRVRAAIEQTRAQKPYMEQVMPPVAVAISIYAPLAGLYLELDEFDSAEAALASGKQMLQPPLDQFMAFSEALVHIRRGQLDAADEALAQAAAIIEQFNFEPLRFQLDLVQSELLAERDQLTEAVALRSKSVDAVRHSILGNELTGQLPAFLAELATLQVDAGMLEDAERSVSQGLALDPNNPRLWLEQARFQQASGLQPLAMASARYALAIWQDADPEFSYLAKAQAVQEALQSTAPQAAASP